jgi:CRP-like cAMP-binding protein
LLTGEPCTATVIVEGGPLGVYTLKPKVFRGIVKGNPQFASHITKLVADRLSERSHGLETLEKKPEPPPTSGEVDTPDPATERD